ncbi:MAG: ornithine carbamoyltransferase [Candidatus Dadabacteria bacterium]|nr:MAG: ornithine carbamoyltransferase [Candidatus Dadabacteria bacterium]
MTTRLRHLTRLLDLERAELAALIERADALRQGAEPRRFPDKILGLVFEKPSTRTRISFEAAAFRLGAGSVFMTQRDSQLQRGEPVRDTARVLGRYLDALALRTFAQETIEESARYAGVPVINALSDRYHPCQTIADLLTLQQHLGRFEGLRLVYLGDGNNVFASLAEAAALVDIDLVFCGPEGYDPDPDLVAEVRELGGRVTTIRDPEQAVAGADVLYTDVWTSMGQEEESERRRRDLASYQINRDLLSVAGDALVLHCLPAHRGEEITDDVIEGAQSRVFDQAENRMWAQMAVLEAIWSRE